MVIRIEAFGRILHLELCKQEPVSELEQPPVSLPTPMVAYSEGGITRDWSSDFVGYVSPKDRR